MKFLQSKSLLLYLTLCHSIAFGQIPRLERLSNRADLLKKDFSMLRDLLENKYPSLYRFSSKEDIDHLLDSCDHSLNEGTTDFEFYKIVKQVFSAIKDGHLYCDPTAKIREHLDTQVKFLPLKLKFISGKTYLWKSADRTVPLGAEILAINGRSMNKIYSDLFRFIVSDGDIISRKFHILNNFFYLYYYIAYGEMERFDIKFKNENGKIEHATINASPKNKIDVNSDTSSSGPLLTINFKPEQVAVMKIQTFDRTTLTENGEEFEHFLDSAFEAIQTHKTNKLIIDLRGNTGGRDVYGAQLYSYLTNKPFRYYKRLQTATLDLDYSQLQRGNSSFDDVNPNMLRKADQRQFLLKEEAHPNLRLWSPNKLNYKGKVWFLIDGLSFSTTAEFAAIARENKRGTFIGEETGGTVAGNTSGYIMEQKLPNTGLTVYLGMIRYEMNINSTVENMRQGVIPDYPIKLNGRDIAANRDYSLDFALKVAKTDRR